MEFTRLNIITDFVSPISKVPQVYASFWKWGALLLALYATFTSLFARIKLYIVRLHSIKHSSLHDHLQQLNNGSKFSDNDDDDDNNNNPLSATKIIDEKFNSIFAFYDDDQFTPYKADQDYRVAGLYSNRDNERKFTDSEHRGNDIYTISNLFTAGKNVVMQWEDLGLGLRLGFRDNYFTSELSIYDACKEENVCTFFDVTRQIPAVANLSPAIIYVTEISKCRNGVKIGAYDRRIRLDNPVMYAEWGPSFGKVVDLSYGGVEKVYVKHGGAGGACTIRDIYGEF